LVEDRGGGGKGECFSVGGGGERKTQVRGKKSKGGPKITEKRNQCAGAGGGFRVFEKERPGGGIRKLSKKGRKNERKGARHL